MQTLVNELIAQGILKSTWLIQAFLAIDRADFVWPEDRYRAYENYPIPIGFGQTISQPLTVAFMLELLSPEKGEKILDIGAGSGWQTALLAYSVCQEIPNSKSQNKPGLLEIKECGKIYAIERIKELCEFGQANLAKYNFLKRGVVEFICADGSQGLASQAPFDKIIVAAVSERVPIALKEQLKVGGRLVLPVGKDDQAIVKIDKLAENKFREEKYPGFIFVPLVSGRIS